MGSECAGSCQGCGAQNFFRDSWVPEKPSRERQDRLPGCSANQGPLGLGKAEICTKEKAGRLLDDRTWEDLPGTTSE